MPHQHQPDNDSLRLELQEATTTFRHLTNLLLQAFGIVVTADSVLVAYGFSQRESGIFLIASLMPIFMMILYIGIITGLIPVAYVAMRLERKLALSEESLITTWALTRDDLPFAKLGGIKDLDDLQVRSAVLNSLPLYLFKSQKGIALLCAALLQIMLFLVSITVFQFKLMLQLYLNSLAPIKFA